MNPLFITLEGIEGSGKSTNIKVINNYLNDKNINYINTREPGGSEVGDQLRNILLNTEKKLSNQTELLLMLADRVNHIETLIQPNLEKGITVISDRFMDSSYAYQGGGREMGLDTITKIIDGLNIIQPNLTLLFDLPVEMALERARKRSKLDRFESEDYDFHQRIRETYLFLAEEDSERIKIIDASKDIEEVESQVRKILEQKL
jgi:dTMP kinase|tara:strand:+ start:1428 stop:2039 length:612 start_codon:yes stop_codon:yes gene_type:complete